MVRRVEEVAQLLNAVRAERSLVNAVLLEEGGKGGEMGGEGRGGEGREGREGRWGEGREGRGGEGGKGGEGDVVNVNNIYRICIYTHAFTCIPNPIAAI